MTRMGLVGWLAILIAFILDAFRECFIVKKTLDILIVVSGKVSFCVLTKGGYNNVQWK